jgi:hypothetical protein
MEPDSVPDVSTTAEHAKLLHIGTWVGKDDVDHNFVNAVASGRSLSFHEVTIIAALSNQAPLIEEIHYP